MITTTTKPLRAFHDDPATKQRYLDRVRAHREADEIVQGTYWAGGRGCAVGCTVHGDDHTAYERELGVSAVLAHLEDRIFEGLSIEEARQWPEQFLSAIPVGADLSRVAPRVLLGIQQRNRARVEHLADINDALRTQVLAAIDGVLATLTDWVATGEAVAAWSAESAAWSAEWSAAESAAASAAEAAERAELVESEAKAAEWTAWAAEWTAESAAESAEWAARAGGAAEPAVSAAWSASAAESAAWSAESAAWSAESAVWSAAAAASVEAAAWSAEAAARSAEAARAECRMMADDLLRALTTTTNHNGATK